MSVYVFLGDSITDADHLFEPAGLGNGFVSLIARSPQMKGHIVRNQGHDGFTTQQIYRKILREGVPGSPSVVSLLVGVNDIPVEVYTSHHRIPDEFTEYYEGILEHLSAMPDTRLVVMEPFLFDKPQEYKNWHPYILEESRIIRTAAQKYHALFVPTDKLLRREARRLGEDAVTTDGIHLTPYGNQLLANLWLNAIASFHST